MISTLLDKYCQNSTGLFLLPLPTGFGKTYQVLEYIVRAYPQLGSRKIFFVTNLKKNLPFEELQQKFRNHKLEKEFSRDAILLDSNAETIIANLEKVAETYFDRLVQIDGFTLLNSHVRELNKIRNEGEIQGLDIKKILEDRIRTELEPYFRKQLTNWLTEKFRGENGKLVTDRHAKIRKVKKEFPWLPLLYPAVLSAEKKIFFLSADKFFVKNTTLIEPSSYFLDDDLTKDALIFIDEFDASKKQFLSAIVDNGNQRRIDFLKLYSQINAGLQGLKFPGELVKDSLQRANRRKNKSKIPSLDQVLEDIKSKSQNLAQQYHLDFVLKTNQPDSRRNFLFQDYRYHTVFRGGNNYIGFQNNALLRQNTLVFSPKQPKNTISLFPLISGLRGFINYFMGGVRILALNYQLRKQESGQKEYSLESAIRSILNLLNLSGVEMNYLIDGILQENWRAGRQEDTQTFPDSNFYLQGFRYYDFQDSDDHDLQSRIFMYNYDNTPEKFLLSLCKRANVIAISATAEMETVVGNYDLKFLQSRLGDYFCELTQDERSDLADAYAEHTKGYKAVELDVQWIEADGSEEEFAEILEDKELATDFYNRIDRKRTDIFKRYVRLFKCLKEFINQSDQLSFLWLSSALPRKNTKAYFNQEIIEGAATQFIKLASNTISLPPTNEILFFLTSDNFDEQKQELQTRLKQGEKLFVVSAYNTVGAGQNLQYVAPLALQPHLVQTNDYPNKQKEKDFDGIYVDRPTNLLINLNGSGSLEEKDFIEAVYQVESLAQKGEISQAHLKDRIRRGFELLSGNGGMLSKLDWKINNLYSKDDFAINAARVVMQAIGRLSRCNLKNKRLALRVDSDLQPLLSKMKQSSTLFTPEFSAIVQQCDQPSVLVKHEKWANKAETVNLRAHSFIQRLLRSTHPNRPDTWKQLREMVLKHPTIIGDELKEYSQLLDLYVELPKGYKYMNFDRAFDDSNSENGSIKNIQFVNNASANLSPEAASLPLLMQNTHLKQFFEENGYATEFHPEAKYILSPALFNDIYKGALGEVVGKYIFEKCGLQLEDLGFGEFELFDFKTSHGLYVDFKHWNLRVMDKAMDEYLPHVIRKAQKVDARLVIIANLFNHQSGFVRQVEEKTVVIPALLEHSNGNFHKTNIQALKSFLHENSD